MYLFGKAMEPNFEEILNKHCPYGHKWSSYLLPDQLKFMTEAMKEAYNLALEDAAESADYKLEGLELEEGVEIDKQSILKLKVK